MYLATLSILYLISIAGGVYGLVNRANMRKSFFWLSIFLLSSGVFQALSYILALIYQNNLLFNNVLVLVYYLIVYLMFSNFTKNKPTLRINNILFIIGGIMILIMEVTAINEGVMALEAITVSNLVFSIASMVYFLDMLRTSSLQSPFKTGKVYALTGFLFYHAAIIFYWVARIILINLETGEIETAYPSTEYINHIMLAIYYTILFVALVVERRDPIKDEF